MRLRPQQIQRYYWLYFWYPNRWFYFISLFELYNYRHGGRPIPKKEITKHWTFVTLSKISRSRIILSDKVLAIRKKWIIRELREKVQCSVDTQSQTRWFHLLFASGHHGNNIRSATHGRKQSVDCPLQTIFSFVFSHNFPRYDFASLVPMADSSCLLPRVPRVDLSHNQWSTVFSI